ncbi:chromosome segregation protein SMC [Maricaulis virginensis]|uniref:Chromosome partition protein Smc n=1 Tax=Maricaulis virginensis TaxID=144022 RepID=A0A9W6IMB9_9PROT|nr:chromosome segregation protein SMC [Maricaulis virginensis]GLK52952.1 chromosome partition protein Smc [Maricaulis virginensis]
MKFTQLRLAGFKSFVDPTDLRIDPGLTGVIGPNGCGKSNLLEALRWVMGATSAKSLRGDGMEDVIFSGTDARPSRNHAEVVLTVDNEDKLAPARFNDADSLEITRRITRGAGSAYKINGEEVRAKDVQLLFMDAGTGANSPALVRQGQISELIAAKPQNRRRILEEAAGVSGLRARRHEAELRLKGAEANLDRLQEVIDDISSRHGSLQRQARQASRYRQLSASIRALEAAVWLNRWREAATAVDTAEAELTDKRDAAETATRAAAEARTQAEILAAAREPARQAEAEAAAALRRLERERDLLERDAAEIERTIERLEARLEELASATGRERQIVEDAQASRDEAARAIAGLDAEIERESANLDAARAAAEATEERRLAAEAELDERAREAADKRAAIETARRDLGRFETRLEQIAREIHGANDERERLEASPALHELETAQVDAEQAETALTEARARLESAEAERQAADAALETAAETWREMASARDGLEREAQALERLLAASMQETVSPALDAVRARPGYEQALAAALGDDLEASLDPSASRHWSEAGVKAGMLPGGCVPLSDHVEAPKALKARLDAIGVIKPEKAAEAAAKLKPGQRLVTRDGDLWRWDGLVARADAPSAAVARLENRNRLDAVRAELEDTAEAHESARAADAAARTAAETARAGEQSARAAIGPADRAARDALARVSSLREKSAQDAARATALKERIERLTAEQAETRSGREAAQAVLEDAEASDGDTEALDAAREAADEARQAAADARARLDGVRREGELRRQRRMGFKRDHDAWAERCKAAEARIADIESQSAEAGKALDEARAKPEVLQEKILALTGKVQAAERAAEEAREAASTTEGQVKEADSAARQAEAAASAAREGRAAAEARLSGARERLNETTERLQDATGEAPGTLSKRVDEDEISELTPAELERRLDEARQGRERLGAVNLRADEEAEELATRMEEMTRERDDLIEAIARLRKAVDELSREGRARLLEAFDVVDGHFRNLFSTLFEGGHAELRLTESDDPLEAGLEIMACPPGKKMENMSLMSGGEQALTASALIFAVFLSNPAPVCVLDEVDAPLDDANVDRYCRMLAEMRRLTETRFLVITHNALTMSRMDRLYGVTMAERGVSQLVSVDLVSAEQLIAAE